MKEVKRTMTDMNSDIERPVNLKPTCIHVRHKLMYVDQRQMQRGMVDDSSDTRVFHCAKTHEPLGPDSEPVCPGDCQAGRACFEPPT